jgi:ATP-dependent exoDNAse (exonuclease V) beta subunit
MSGGISFRGFVEELTAQAEKAEAAEAPVLEEDSDGVRLMTVHGAKGLEFPVVILADLTANISARDPDQYVDAEAKLCATRLLRCAPWELLDHEADEAFRERAEGVRVAYVAATRARDLLVVPAVGDEPFPSEGWLSPLDKALYPDRGEWRAAQEAEGCPKFGQVTVMDRPRDYDGQPEMSVRPGLIAPQVGSHSVVWWDPYKLHLGAEADYGMRQEDLLRDDGGIAAQAYREWKDERAATIVSGSKAEFEIFLPSQTALVAPGAVPVEYVATAKAERPGGRRFGALVHAGLRDVGLTAGEGEIRKIVEMNARVLGATEEEARAACVAVEAALGHPVLERARSVKRCHREYPVTMRLEGNRVMEGVIDLAFVEKREWVVVDFKTDAELGDKRRQYERQLQWYAYALREITGMGARAVLMGV